MITQDTRMTRAKSSNFFVKLTPFLKMPRSIKRLVDETEQIRLPAHQIDIEVGVNPFEDRIRVAEHLRMSRSHSLRLK
jgi:hypothetical protein